MMIRRASVASESSVVSRRLKHPVQDRPLSGAFDFDKEVKPTDWLVEGLIPEKMFTLLLGKSKSGKSWFAEYLAICAIYGHPFLGRITRSSDVLFVDQDTITEVLENRFKDLQKPLLNEERMGTLYIKPHEELYLYDDSLLRAINEYASVKLVILDSLHQIAGGDLDTNQTQDMKTPLVKLKNAIAKNGQTLLLLHHISQKEPMTVDEMMISDDVDKMGMGNSVIIQMADNILLLGSKDQRLQSLCIRPRPKKVLVDEAPFVVRLSANDDGGKEIVMNGLWQEPMPWVDKDIIMTLSNYSDWQSVRDLAGIMKWKYRVDAIQGGVKRLLTRGLIEEARIHPKFFMYRLKDRTGEVIPRGLTRRRLHARGRRTR